MKKLILGLMAGAVMLTLAGCGQPTPAEKKAKQAKALGYYLGYFKDGNKQSIKATQLLIADSKTVLPKDFNEREYKNPFIKKPLKDYNM